MWRSNALKLRHCPSPATTRNKLSLRRYGSDSGQAVTAEEFKKALTVLLPWNWKHESKGRVGFAISGGVDSMALAFLYARARKEHSLFPKAYGFIVDHKARPESTDEAEWVAEMLRWHHDMEASVLTVTWPDGCNPHGAKNFETLARTLRYQALGRACRDHHITALMVAHHADDQAETVMMRLANNRLRTGLKGMLSAEWIPECEGIYGVHQSGKTQRPDISLDIPFPVEQGGIRILRPLLGLEKSRLIATCQQNDVDWADDRTNQDPTLASRNAIRHIYKNHELPEALSIRSLVNTSLHMQRRLEAHRLYAERLFNQCLLKLDIQTGALLVRFPPYESLLPRPIETESDILEARDNAYCLIERVAELVTCKFKPTLGQLASRIDNIYPEFMTPEDGQELYQYESHSTNNFTVYHIWWRRWDKASPFEDVGLPSEDFSATAPHPKEWILTRNPLEQAEAKKMQIIVPPKQPTGLDSSSKSKETYQLFDGRFWVELENFTRDTLIIRTFEKDDMRHLPLGHKNRMDIKNASRNFFGLPPDRFIIAAFSLIKPADIRFTLPAVFRKDSVTDEEKLIGFPTLNVCMHGLGGPPEDVCKWRVRYKKIDFGQHAPGDIIVPGVKRQDIIAEDKRLRMGNRGITKLKVRGRRAIDDTHDRFTGFKRVSAKDREKYERARNLVYTQKAMEGEELEGLSFMEDETANFKEEMSKEKKKSGGRSGAVLTKK